MITERLLGFYQRRISPALNANQDSQCLYVPSCSAYAREAVALRGTRDGLIDAAGRLARCNRENHERVHERFRQALESCGNHDEVAARFPCDGAAGAVLLEVFDGYQEARRLRSEGQPDEAAALERATGNHLEAALHVAVEDRPGVAAEPRFVVSTPHAHKAVPWTAGRAVGAAVGAVVGGVSGAVLESALLGLVLMPLAACGRDVTQWLEKRCGSEGASALGHVITGATGPAAAGRRRLGGAAALVVGVPLGLVGGVVHGAWSGGRWGWRVGRALGKQVQ